ncbi:MAG: hypothetical protein JWN70_5776 [Planctomycetaceae bacterium]|nr:hypothetical protein [Planctomycetaceae bacterium]
MCDLLMRQLRLSTCVFMAAAICGCGPAVVVPKPTPAPFTTVKNDGIIHEIYRGVTLDEFTPTLPSGSLDSIDFDMTIPNYAIVLVTASATKLDASVEFTTTFFVAHHPATVKTWSVVPGNHGEIVRGLFVVANEITSATTTRSTTATDVENDNQRASAGT